MFCFFFLGGGRPLPTVLVWFPPIPTEDVDCQGLDCFAVCKLTCHCSALFLELCSSSCSLHSHLLLCSDINGVQELRPERQFAGVSRPSGPEIQKKSRKESFCGSAKKSPKIPKKIEKYSKKTQIWTFSCVSRLFRVFSGTFLQTPKKTLFETFLGFGPRRARRLL